MSTYRNQELLERFALLRVEPSLWVVDMSIWSEDLLAAVDHIGIDA